MFLADGSYFIQCAKKKKVQLSTFLEIRKTNTSILFTHFKDFKCINLSHDIASPLWINHVLQRTQKFDNSLLHKCI